MIDGWNPSRDRFLDHLPASRHNTKRRIPMRSGTSRRHFLATSAGAVAGTWLSHSLSPRCTRAEEEKNTFDTKLYKALIARSPTEQLCEEWAAAGIQGMEVQNFDLTPEEAFAKQKTADSFGIRIHSVMRGWARFNHEDPEVVKQSIEETKKAIRAAAGYGADAILLVPCRVGGMTMPEPWNYDIEFDPKTCRVSRVAAGDNTPYQEYIQAQNYATESSRRAIEELIPLAAKEGVMIAIENVWNHLWCSPELFASFVRSFDHPWIKMYFDIGNHVKYALPEEWLLAAGPEVVKIHVKDFTIDKSKPRGGDFVNIREGQVDWPKVRKMLEQIRYNGWITVEGSRELSPEKLNKRLDLIIAGK
jgi:hexulose-6-phosphate isomerase